MITLDVLNALENTNAKFLEIFCSDEQDIYYKGSAMVHMGNAPTGSWVWTLGPRWRCLFRIIVDLSGGGP